MFISNYDLIFFGKAKNIHSAWVLECDVFFQFKVSVSELALEFLV